MKKFFLLFTISLSVLAASGQNYETVKTNLLLQKYKEAKTELDKQWGNGKFASKPEAYLLKTWVYASLANEPATKETPEGEKLMADADAAFAKYMEMDPQLSLLNDAAYQNGPINLYTILFSSGYKDYENKKWQSSFEKFKKVVGLSDMLIKQKVISIAVDTNSIVMAGITAENSGNRDDAAIYYTRLADLRMPGADYEGIYRFLVGYYFGKKDIASFEKYKKIGEQLYPKSDYFKFDRIDFAIGLNEKFDDKIKAMEEILAADPNNYKATQALGELIYDTLNPRKGDPPAPGAETDAWEKKMIAAFNKAIAIQPATVNAYLYLGDHFITKAVKAGEARDVVISDVNKRTKPGAQPSKEDAAKKDLADKQYGDALEMAREPYEKVAEIYGKTGQLDPKDKQQYKKAVGYLSDIYAYKKVQSKGKPADVAKYTAEQKKWDDLYETLK